MRVVGCEHADVVGAPAQSAGHVAQIDDLLAAALAVHIQHQGWPVAEVTRRCRVDDVSAHFGFDTIGVLQDDPTVRAENPRTLSRFTLAGELRIVNDRHFFADVSLQKRIGIE